MAPPTWRARKTINAPTQAGCGSSCGCTFNGRLLVRLVHDNKVEQGPQRRSLRRGRTLTCWRVPTGAACGARGERRTSTFGSAAFSRAKASTASTAPCCPNSFLTSAVDTAFRTCPATRAHARTQAGAGDAVYTWSHGCGGAMYNGSQQRTAPRRTILSSSGMAGSRRLRTAPFTASGLEKRRALAFCVLQQRRESSHATQGNVIKSIQIKSTQCGQSVAQARPPGRAA